jgi:predicted porin
MNIRLLACTLATLFAGSAAAQTSVTIYGVADAGLVRESGGTAGTLTKISSGIGSVSRLGFRGTEDLGSGLSANYVLELGTKIDTGEIDTAGTTFNRQAFVGLKSAAVGALTLGRQYTPYYVTLGSVADPNNPATVRPDASSAPRSPTAADRSTSASATTTATMT